MAKKGDRVLITLACSECRERNFHTTKSKRNDPQRLERRRYCPRCQTHVVHREVR